jgi:hypothetical protein
MWLAVMDEHGGFADSISRMPEALHGLAGFICNHIEIGRICGQDFAENDQAGLLRLLPEFAGQHRLQSAENHCLALAQALENVAK